MSFVQCAINAATQTLIIYIKLKMQCICIIFQLHFILRFFRGISISPFLIARQSLAQSANCELRTIYICARSRAGVSRSNHESYWSGSPRHRFSRSAYTTLVRNNNDPTNDNGRYLHHVSRFRSASKIRDRRDCTVFRWSGGRRPLSFFVRAVSAVGALLLR